MTAHTDTRNRNENRNYEHEHEDWEGGEPNQDRDPTRWKPWHEPVANQADGPEHITRADCEPRTLTNQHYIDQNDTVTTPVTCQYPGCDREYDTIRGHNYHVTATHYPSVIEVDCGWCGKTMHRKPSLAKGRNFCDSACAARWNANNNHSHAAFQNEQPFRIGTWKIAIRDALIRTNHRPRWETIIDEQRDKHEVCEMCEKNIERNLSVNHAIPVLAGGVSDDANLTVLCTRCHSIADSQIQNELDNHSWLPRSGEANPPHPLRPDKYCLKQQSEKERKEKQCESCGITMRDGLLVREQPVIPVEAGGVFTEGLIMEFCNACWEQATAFLYKHLPVTSDQLLHGKAPDPGKIQIPEYDNPGTPFDAGGARELSGKHEIYTEDLIEDLQRVADDLGSTPTQKDMRKHGTYNVKTFERRFGSWNESVEAAGLEPNMTASYHITADKLITELQHLAEELGRTPTQKDMRKHGTYSVKPYITRFRLWNTAIEKAGLEPNT